MFPGLVTPPCLSCLSDIASYPFLLVSTAFDSEIFVVPFDLLSLSAGLGGSSIRKVPSIYTYTMVYGKRNETAFRSTREAHGPLFTESTIWDNDTEGRGRVRHVLHLWSLRLEDE